MFQRRVARNKQQILREALWPSMGPKRLALYYKHRVGRLPGTPAQIASGFATGVAVSFTPFVGCHLMLGALIAWLSRASLISMVVGTLAGNPWTFPFIWLVTYKLGHLMLGHLKRATGSNPPGHFTLAHLMEKPVELLIPPTLGAIPFCFVSWLLAFYICRHLVTKYRAARLAKLVRKES